MTSSNSDRPTDRDPFPLSSVGDPLGRSKNLSPADLARRIPSQSPAVYCYVIATIKTREGQLAQAGCGPNFHGGLISLCTGKHFMRSFRGVRSWKGTWIAGFTRKSVGGGRNALVYLMQVGHAFESHYDLWASPEGTIIADKSAKSARRNPLGDLYEPKGELLGDDRFDPGNYHAPCRGHSHARQWHQDVSYRGRGGRPAALLVGDAENSFVWDTPAIFFADSLGRGQKKLSLGDLLHRLSAG